MVTFIVKCSDVVYDVRRCDTDCENTFSYFIFLWPCISV